MKLLVRVVVAAFLLGVACPLAAEARVADPEPVIPDTPVFDAPIGDKGGIENPPVYCTDFAVEPRVRWVLENRETGEEQTYTWRGALPGLYFPRVDVGTYRSTTTAWCQGAKSHRSERVEVLEKTPSRTMSWKEFTHVQKGMTPTQVRHVVGFGGRASGGYGGERTRTYDLMAFWAWSIVVYRDGRVVHKYWDVGHD